ncbi:MAG: DUF2568 domain-containing protein [Opitutaceae bacterium]
MTGSGCRVANNPLNLLLRLALEMAALIAFGVWGWSWANGPLRFLICAACVILPAAMWGIFRMKNDGGTPVIEVGGRVRLLLEIVFFTLACGAGVSTGNTGLAGTLGIVCLLHYGLSYDRVIRMFRGG